MTMQRFAARSMLWALPLFALACADPGGDTDGANNDALIPEMAGLLRGDGSEFEEGAAAADDLIDHAAAGVGVHTAALEEGGTCCPDGNCVCRGGAPSDSTLNRNGPFRTSSYSRGLRNGPEFGGATVYYPTDAPAPLSGVVMCPGYTARQSSIASWGPFFASHGIVLVTVDTNTTGDQVPQRAEALLDALASLKAENTRRGSPLEGKLSADRFGLAGWSMGGGGTWIATRDHPEIKSAVTLAGHNATAGGGLVARGSRVPTLMLNGANDVTILGGLGQSEASYDALARTTPKLLYVMSGEGHFSWGTPTTNNNASGRYVMAWEKVFLEGDQRYKRFLLERGPRASTFQSANLN